MDSCIVATIVMVFSIITITNGCSHGEEDGKLGLYRGLLEVGL